MFKKYWPARLQLPHQFVLGKGVGHTIDGHDRSVRKLPHCKSSTVKKYLAITSLKLPPYRTTSKLTFIHCEEGNSIHPASTGDFRIWTRFLRKYVYFRVMNIDFNPYCTLGGLHVAQLCRLW